MKPLLFPAPGAQRAADVNLTALRFLEVALSSCEALLLGSHPELTWPGSVPRGAASRASTAILISRRLAVALACYREAVQREQRRPDRPF